MTQESPDDTDSLEQLQSFLAPADGGRIVQEAIDDTLERLQWIKGPLTGSSPG